MDQNEKQELQTTSQSNKYRQYLKKTMHLLFAVSVLLLFLSYSSAISHFFHYFSFRFSALLFNQTLERKYIFLICNGIVAVLVKNLSFAASSPLGSDLCDEYAKTDEDGVKPVSEIEALVEDKEVAMESAIGSLENVTLWNMHETDDRQPNDSDITFHMPS